MKTNRQTDEKEFETLSSVERELFCVFKISIVFGTEREEIGLGIDSEGVLEILSKCLHRIQRVVCKTDVLRRIFIRSFLHPFDLWNWQIFDLGSPLLILLPSVFWKRVALE